MNYLYVIYKAEINQSISIMKVGMDISTDN
jgi:hypothetical protein